MKNLFLIAVIVLGFSAVSFAQDTETANASATIITPISIVNAGDMNFGNVSVNAIGGTVVLTPAGGRTVTGVTLPVVAGTVSAASFTVSGLGTSTFSISLPTEDLVITSGTNEMIVNAFTSTPSATGTLAGGTATISVGATLNVAAEQPAGLYESATPFEVTVNYN